MNSLVAGSGSRTGAGLAGLSAARYRFSIETSLTAFTPWPGGVMETLLLVRTHRNKEDCEIHGTVEYTVVMVCFHMLRFAKKPLVHSTAQIKAGSTRAKTWERRRRREESKTYQTPASLRVTAAGVTIAVTPLTSAKVEARAGPSVTIITLLQRHGKTPQVRDK